MSFQKRHRFQNPSLSVHYLEILCQVKSYRVYEKKQTRRILKKSLYIRIHNIELFKKDKPNLLTDSDFPLIGLIPSDEENQGVPDLVVVAEEPYLGLEYTLHIPPNLRHCQMEMPRF